MENTKINVLGTEYTICERTEEQDCRLKNCDGYCDKTSKEIVVIHVSAENCDLHRPKWYADKVLRHEIVHAFLFESGMHECTNWDAKESCHNEQLVDWFAIQSPKIFKVYKELGILDLPIYQFDTAIVTTDGTLQRISVDANRVVEEMQSEADRQKGETL